MFGGNISHFSGILFRIHCIICIRDNIVPLNGQMKFELVKFVGLFGANIRFKVSEHSFDTCVSFFSKTLDRLVVKNGNTQINNTNFGPLIARLTYVPLPQQNE